MRVIVADDHRIVREGIAFMVSDVDDVEIVGEAANGAELLDLLREVETDLVLLDLRMPDMNGLEALPHLSEIAPEVKVIVLSMHDESAYVRRAIELGADGYVLKSAGRDELLRALALVSSGKVYIQGELATALVREVAAPDAGPSLRLEEEEVAIIRLVARGLENKQIARRTGSTEAAVKSSLRSIFGRLGVRTRAEAVAVAIRAGLID